MAEFKNEISSMKFKLVFQNNGGSYTYSNIRTDATADAIYKTACAFALLKKKYTEEVYQIIDRDLYEE